MSDRQHTWSFSLEPFASLSARYGLALLVITVATLVRAAFPGVFSSTPYLVFYPAVVAAAAFGGFGPALLASIVSGLIVGLFFALPGGASSVLTDPIQLTRFAVFLLGGLVIGGVAERRRIGRQREQKQAEKLSELVRLTDLANVMILDADTSRIGHWNTGCTHLYGFTPEQAMGRVSHELLQTHFPEPLEAIKATLRRQGRWEGELIHTRQDGKAITVASVWVLHRDSADKPCSILEVNNDISARKAAEQRLRVLFENAGVGIVEVERDDHFVAVNQRACEILSRSQEELLSMKAHDLTWPDDRPLSEHVNQAIHEGSRDRVTYVKRYIRGNGSPVWANVTVSGVRDTAGRWCRSITTIEDISEQKAVEEALKQSEYFYRQTLDSIPGMVFTTRPDGYCDYQSQQWVDFTGVPMSEHLGDGWNKLLHPDDRPRAYDAWRAAVEDRAPYDLEYRVRRYDGEYRWFKVRGRPIRDAQGQIVRWFGTALEIEDLKRAHEDLTAARYSAEQAKAAAEEANRAKDQFLAVLSHELRTPLTPVLATVSMLQRQPEIEKLISSELEMIRRNAELEARLIDDLLDLTRISRGKVELDKKNVELCTIIERAAEVCRPDIETRQLHFGIDYGPRPYLVNADISRLQQVFWNLLRNSIKFTPRGGCVGIRCRPEEGHVLVEVNDSGIGISAHALASIFDAFAQADRGITRQFGGLGLGLAICKSLVQLHDGTISARSEGQGRGATFTVRLPLVPRTAAKTAAASAGTSDSARPRVRSLRLLVVEDHGDTSEMLRLMLQAEGHEVVTAGDVSAALTAVGQHEFDMLLSDLGLPDGSGLDLIRKVRANGLNMPAIALSGYGQERDIQQSKAAGFSAHVTKPVDLDRLLDAISRVGITQV